MGPIWRSGLSRPDPSPRREAPLWTPADSSGDRASFWGAPKLFSSVALSVRIPHLLQGGAKRMASRGRFEGSENAGDRCQPSREPLPGARHREGRRPNPAGGPHGGQGRAHLDELARFQLAVARLAPHPQDPAARPRVPLPPRHRPHLHVDDHGGLPLPLAVHPRGKFSPGRQRGEGTKGQQAQERTAKAERSGEKESGGSRQRGGSRPPPLCPAPLESRSGGVAVRLRPAAPG